ncbi:MAG: hypothetical protein ACE5EV_06515, partial [Gaiellales bacterium]
MRVSRRLLLGVFLLPGLALALPSLAHSHPRAHTLVLDGAGGGVDPPLVSGSAGQGPARSTAGAGATDGIRLAVLPATFVDDERVPLTRRQLRQRIFGPGVSVAGFYARASSGAMELTGDVLDPITVPLRADACDPTGWADAARAVVGDAALAAYSH